jgi:hypothetical protein
MNNQLERRSGTVCSRLTLKHYAIIRLNKLGTDEKNMLGQPLPGLNPGTFQIIIRFTDHTNITFDIMW